MVGLALQDALQILARAVETLQFAVGGSAQDKGSIIVRRRCDHCIEVVDRFVHAVGLGTQQAAVDKMQTRVELYDVLGYQAYEDKLDALFRVQGLKTGEEDGSN